MFLSNLKKNCKDATIPITKEKSTLKQGTKEATFRHSQPFPFSMLPKIDKIT